MPQQDRTSCGTGIRVWSCGPRRGSIPYLELPPDDEVMEWICCAVAASTLGELELADARPHLRRARAARRRVQRVARGCGGRVRRRRRLRRGRRRGPLRRRAPLRVPGAKRLLRGDDRVVKGYALEPGLLTDPIHADDPLCLPVYEFCIERHLPLILSAGGNVGPDCGHTLPIHVDRVARDFPKLNIVVAHGGWPWITAIHHVAFRRGNVYVSPDMYALMPGNEAYITAMNSYLSERFVYASSFPFVPLRGYLESFLRVVANDVVAERVLFSNAARLIGIA